MDEKLMMRIDDATAVLLSKQCSGQVIGWLPVPEVTVAEPPAPEPEVETLVVRTRTNPYERAYGDKYDSKLTTTEVAKRFRADVKAAVKAGELPKGLKLSVRTSYFAGGSSIHVSIKAAPGVRVLNPEWVRLTKEDPHNYHMDVDRYTVEVRALLKKLEGMLFAYNHDGCDTQTDYFDVKFYSSVNVAWELEQAEKGE